MTVVAARTPTRVDGLGRSRDGYVERWIFVGTAALIVAVVLIGFIPSSLSLLERVSAGEREGIPATLHLHAIFMGLWLALLLAQATLMATGNARLHMQLGRVAFLLVPAMVVTGMVLVPMSMAGVQERLATMPPQAAEELAFLLPMLNNIMLAQIGAGISFPLLVGMALYYRTRRPQTHKRLMVFATAMPLAAATDRIGFLPTTLPDNPLTMIIYPLIVLVPLLIWDISRGGKLDRAWSFLAIVLIVKWSVTWLLWGSDWWAVNGPRLAGLS